VFLRTLKHSAKKASSLPYHQLRNATDRSFLTQSAPVRATLKAAKGWFGGTFDPPHIAHLLMGLTAKEALNLAELRFMPVHIAPHKTNISSALHRRHMIEAATAGIEGVSVDLVEYERPIATQTADTINILRARHPDTPICFIMGMDGLMTFPTWDNWQVIINNAHLVIVDRPAYELPKSGLVADLLKQRLKTDLSVVHQSLGGHIVICPTSPQLDISSTDIRKTIAAGRTPHYLLPPKVQQYINTHQLYKPSVTPTLLANQSLFKKTEMPLPPSSLPQNSSAELKK
jgi:nicotinate-nucleotide adenylyltransferase